MLKKVIQINESDFSTLKTTGSITIGGVTYTYSPTDTLYIVENCGVPHADQADIATYATTAGTANQVSWANVSNKPELLLKTYGINLWKFDLTISGNTYTWDTNNHTWSELETFINSGKTLWIAIVDSSTGESIYSLNNYLYILVPVGSTLSVGNNNTVYQLEEGTSDAIDITPINITYSVNNGTSVSSNPEPLSTTITGQKLSSGTIQNTATLGIGSTGISAQTFQNTNISLTTGGTGKVLYNGNEVATKTDIPTSLSQLSDDTTHRLVTDTEKTNWNGKSKVTTLSLVKNQQDEFELEDISSFSDFVDIIQNNDKVILDYNESGVHIYFDEVLLWGNAYIFTSPVYFGGNGILSTFSLSEGDNDSINIMDGSITIPSDSDVVHISNAETITGAKTFSDSVTLNGVASSVDSGSRLTFSSNGILKGRISANTSGGLNLQNGSGDALYLISNSLYNRLRAGTVLGTVGNPFGTLHTNGTINKYIDGTSEYTLTLPSITDTLATEGGTVAKIGSNEPGLGTSGYLKIKLNEPVNTMSSLYINLYSGYDYDEYIISGYNYSTTKIWHYPKVTLRSSNKGTKTVYFGYDGDNDLWIAIPHGGYHNVSVSEAANNNGTKTPIKDITFTWDLSTDTSQWTGTIQSEVTVYPLIDSNDLQTAVDEINDTIGDINAVLQLVNFGNDESS